MFRDDNRFEDLNEIHQKLANQSMSSFEERRNEMNKSKNVFVGAVSGIALAAVVGWFVLSPRYENSGSTDIPVVRRPQTAIKIQPAEPGGMEILNQDKTVYDIIEKKGDDSKVVENLLPPPEEPQLPTAIEPEEDVLSMAEATVSAAEKVKTEPQAIPLEPKDVIVEKKIEEIKIVEEVKPSVEKIELPKKAEAPVIEEPKRIDKVAAADITDAPKQYSFEDFKNVNPSNPGRYAVSTDTAAAAAAVDSEFDEEIKSKGVPSGYWQIQLMSSPNKGAVEKAWKDLSKKYYVLASQNHEVETADLGAKGTYYRLKAGAFKNRTDADALCKDVTALGGTCIVTKKP